MVGRFLGVAVAGEGEGLGLEVDFERIVGDVRGTDCEVDIILFRIAGGGTLGPGYCGLRISLALRKIVEEG